MTVDELMAILANEPPKAKVVFGLYCEPYAKFRNACIDSAEGVARSEDAREVLIYHNDGCTDET